MGKAIASLVGTEYSDDHMVDATIELYRRGAGGRPHRRLAMMGCALRCSAHEGTTGALGLPPDRMNK